MKKGISSAIVSVIAVVMFCGIGYAFTPGSVQVTVRDFYSDEPVAGAQVLMTPGNYTATTDEAGIVLFENITPYRNYSIKSTAEGYVEDKYGEGRTGFVWVETGQTTAVVTPLKKESEIYGKVISKGAPVAGALLLLIEERLGLQETVAGTHTDDDGTYLLQHVPEGDYTMIAVADSYYQSEEAFQLNSDESIRKDFTIRPGLTFISYKINESQNFYGNSVSFTATNLALIFNPRYVVPVTLPEGAELVKTSSSSLTPTLPGDYIFSMMILSFRGVGREEYKTIEMVNDPPAAYPSIIPGPSELPLLYNSGTVTAETSGLAGVRPGEKVYLRGWGEDQNLPSPEQYNPDASGFDIYGNKNGSWSQSAFLFSWQLVDKNSNDISSLLDNASAENTFFTVPSDAAPGDTYTARLTVTGDAGLAGEPGEVTAYVAEQIGTEKCASCHDDRYGKYKNTKHAQVGVGCESCHGPGSLHNGNTERISKTHWPGMCGRCHTQFAQWQKSRHSDPLAFGHSEVSPALIGNCYKCHYTEGFIEASQGKSFDKFRFPFGVEVPHDTPNVGCDVCHNPHQQSSENPVGIRTGTAASLCVTCHEKKWQNATYSGEADKVGNGYHWADYSQYREEGNPHHNSKGCVMCHMAKDITETDNNSVLLVGGHGMRMRDVGLDGDPGTADDVLNVKVCQTCHAGLATFDRNNAQTENRAKVKQLGEMLKAENQGFMPPFQPGKCATCHRGSNLPFINDDDAEILKHAYLNYSLILNDRSFGVHNPGYIKRLLDDSIAAVENFKSRSGSEIFYDPARAVPALQSEKQPIPVRPVLSRCPLP